ncbi:MAG TPA: DUF4265 domain-containing protein [Caulobacteraceae bacterium]|jgi:hypothetical protein
MTAPIELLFKLDGDDEWPPAVVEGLWGEQDGTSFRVLTCPLFVRGLSVGDVIAPETDDAGDVVAFEVLERSSHSTVWVLAEDPAIREELRSVLESLGCGTVGGPESIPSLCAVDVPGEVEIDAIDAVLGEPERTGQISIAYPSFRHASDE